MSENINKIISKSNIPPIPGTSVFAYFSVATGYCNPTTQYDDDDKSTRKCHQPDINGYLLLYY